MSVDLFAAGGFDGDGIGACRVGMALMHAMQSSHALMEPALVRVLNLLGEEVLTGRDWHADLIKRASRGIAGRPAILPPDLARAAGETRRFRNVAMEGYGSFDVELSRPAVLAAGFVARNLGPAILLFRAVIDPAPQAGAGPHAARNPASGGAGWLRSASVPMSACDPCTNPLRGRGSWGEVGRGDRCQ